MKITLLTNFNMMDIWFQMQDINIQMHADIVQSYLNKWLIYMCAQFVSLLVKIVN